VDLVEKRIKESAGLPDVRELPVEDDPRKQKTPCTPQPHS
jgi:hypothetical protein